MKGDMTAERQPQALVARKRYARPAVAAHGFDSVVQSGSGMSSESFSGKPAKLSTTPSSDDA